ncbi:MAG: fimbrillin family protein [Bacteroides sp.]|nr:fimbrillin family protein [Bacteroides sp.]
MKGTTGTTGGSGNYSDLFNCKGTYSTIDGVGVWRPVTDVYLLNKSTTVAVHAPYDATQGKLGTAGTLHLEVQKAEGKDTDGLFCSAYTVSKTQNLDDGLTLNQLYAELGFDIALTNYNSKAEITNITITGGTSSGLPLSADYNVFATGNNYSYAYSSDHAFSPDITPLELEPTKDVKKYLLMIPIQLTQEMTLTLTVNGKTMKTTIATSDISNSAFVAKHLYTFYIRLKPSALSVDDVTVEDWEAVDVKNEDGTDNGMNWEEDNKPS